MKKVLFIVAILLIQCLGIAAAPQDKKILQTHSENQGYVLLLNFYRGGNDWSNGIQDEVIRHLVDKKTTFYIKNLFLSTVDNEKNNPNWWKNNLTNLPVEKPKIVFILGDIGWVIYRHYLPSDWKSIPCIVLPARRDIVPFKYLSQSMEINPAHLIPFEKTMKGYKVIGLMHNHYCAETVNMIKHLQPNLKRIMFISDSRVSSSFVRYKMKNVMSKDFKDLEYISIERSKFSTHDLLDTIKKLDQCTGLIYYSWFGDPNNLTEERVDYTKKMVSAYSRVPVFTLSDYKIATDASLCGGYFNSTKDIAKSVNNVIDDIFSNRAVKWGTIISINTPRYYLNYLQLINKGISASLFPDGAVYYEKPISFYDRHKYTIWVFWAMCIAIFVLILKYAFTQRNLKQEKEKEIMHLTRYKKLFSNMPIAYLRYYVKADVVDKMSTATPNTKVKFWDRQRDTFTYQMISKNIVCNHLFTGEDGINRLGEIEQMVFSIEHRDKIAEVAKGSPSFYMEITNAELQRHYDTYICPSEMKSIIDIFMLDKTKQVESSRQVLEYARMNGRILNMLADTIIIFYRDKTIETVMNPSEHNLVACDKSIIGKRLGDYHVSGVTDKFERSIDEAFWSNELVTFDYNMNHEGEMYYFHVRMNTLSDNKVCCTIHEYTEIMRGKLQLEQNKLQLEHLNHRLQTVLDAAHVIPWTIDLQKKTVMVQSEVYPIENQITAVHPDDYENYLIEMKKLIDCPADAHYMLSHNVRVKWNSEDFRWYKMRCVIDKRDDDGNPLILIGSAEDIDLQRQLEQRLIDAKEKAEESNMLKSSFIANMSHEIRTPLNAIVGFSNILATTDDLAADDRKEFIKNINLNSDLLLQLINDILDLSKIDAGTIDFVYEQDDFTGIVKDVMTATKIRKMKSQKVTFVLDDIPESCVTYTDRRRLTQVINNFITNAMKFTSNGSITLGYRVIDNSSIYCYVSDTGIGISPDQQKRIFERFVKLNSFKQGTGLGLSICQTIIEKMNGEIGVSSEFGKGSTFWFKLPILNEAPTEDKE